MIGDNLIFYSKIMLWCFELKKKLEVVSKLFALYHDYII